MGAIQGNSTAAGERELKAKAQALLQEIQADLALLPGATTAQTKEIMGRCLQRQAKIIRFLANRL